MVRDILLIIAGGIVTLICRYLWDRYFSQSSRVTVKEFTEKISYLEQRLNAGTETFKRINSCLAATCLIMLELCEKTGIDCSNIRKQMIESGLDF